MMRSEEILKLRERRDALCKEIAIIDRRLLKLGVGSNTDGSARRGELPGAVLAILSDREDGLTAREIGILAAKRGVGTQSKEFTRTVFSACNRLVRKGKLRSSLTNGRRLFFRAQKEVWDD